MDRDEIAERYGWREGEREPVSDIDTVVVDSLKALDPNRPIREADMAKKPRHIG